MRLQLRALQKRLAPRRITLDVSDDALDAVTALGHNPEYGARPLKRSLQKALETPLARALIDPTPRSTDLAHDVEAVGRPLHGQDGPGDGAI